MGRWFVILLASALAIGVGVHFLPGLYDTCGHWMGASIPWLLPVGGVIVYAFHRMTSKG